MFIVQTPNKVGVFSGTITLITAITGLLHSCTISTPAMSYATGVSHVTLLVYLSDMVHNECAVPVLLCHDVLVRRCFLASLVHVCVLYTSVQCVLVWNCKRSFREKVYFSLLFYCIRSNVYR